MNIAAHAFTHLRIHAFTVVCLAWLLSQTAEACPGCKEALFDPGTLPQRLSTAKGYALSIALMLSIPVALVGAIALGIVRAIRRQRRGSGSA